MRPNRFLITIIFLLMLGFIFSPYLGPVRNIVAEITGPFSKFFTSSGTSIGDFFSTIGKIKDLSKENNQLKERNLQLESELVSLKEVGHENKILKKELGFFAEDKGYQLIPVQVVGYSSAGFLQSLKINKGSTEGIELGRAVLSQGFLIGRVSQLNSDNAEVSLITNSNSLIPVVLQDSRGTGLLKGGLAGLIIEDIALDTEIKIGENVLSSGLGGELPSGLAIGTIKEIISASSEIFQRVEVKSPVEFGKLEIVFIIK